MDAILSLSREGLGKWAIAKRLHLPGKLVGSVLRGDPNLRRQRAARRNRYQLLRDAWIVYQRSRVWEEVPLMKGPSYPVTVEADESVDGKAGVLVRGRVSKGCGRNAADIGPNGYPLMLLIAAIAACQE